MEKRLVQLFVDMERTLFGVGMGELKQYLGRSMHLGKIQDLQFYLKTRVLCISGLIFPESKY